MPRSSAATPERAGELVAELKVALTHGLRHEGAAVVSRGAEARHLEHAGALSVPEGSPPRTCQARREGAADLECVAACADAEPRPRLRGEVEPAPSGVNASPVGRRPGR